MRQRAFVVLNPCQIARVEIAAAERTFEIMISLVDASRSPIKAPRGIGSSIGMILVK